MTLPVHTFVWTKQPTTMPPFPKPKFAYTLDVAAERSHLRAHKTKRHVPARKADRLLVATWNIANLGVQDRKQGHYQLIAEMIGWFDLVAVQEVNGNLVGLRAILAELPKHYAVTFSDAGGNNERSAFIYDSRKLERMELVGEVAVPPSDFNDVKLPGISAPFQGFDRNPYICSFGWGKSVWVLLTVHSFFGSETSKADNERRALETYAIARWVDLERKSKNAYSPLIMAMGDFNLPMVQPGDPVYDALRKRGMKLPDHTSKVYSNITDDKQYDQIAFLPGMKAMLQDAGIFDFDNALFPDLYAKSKANFKTYTKYYISDHRPFWMELGL